MIRADLESLAEEGEIFREDEPYQILREHIEALLPVVKGWNLRRLVKAIRSTRFHRDGKSLLEATAPEIRYLAIHLGTCTANLIYDRCQYVRLMALFKIIKDDQLLVAYYLERSGMNEPRVG